MYRKDNTSVCQIRPVLGIHYGLVQFYGRKLQEILLALQVGKHTAQGMPTFPHLCSLFTR